jgi:predicted RNA-binding protein associated with RNAse of E/G family
MKNIISIFLMYFPLLLLAQNSLEKSRVEDRAKWVDIRERIESAVERGEITHEQADKRYAEFRRRMELRDNKGKNNDKSNVKDIALWEGFQRRIESAVEQGLITPEQARERYAGFRKRMAQREKTTDH